MDDLKALEGVFYINESAWIFDTRTALQVFAEVTYLAIEKGIQLYVFQLDAESLRSQAVSYPKSEKLAISSRFKKFEQAMRTVSSAKSLPAKTKQK